VNATGLRITAGARAFTIIEMLTVVLILSILMGLVVAGVYAANRAARRRHTQNQITVLKAYLEQYCNDYRDYPNGNGQTDGDRDFESIETLYLALTTAKGRFGPYIEDPAALRPQDLDGNGKVEITDHWGTPMRYTHSRYYKAGVEGPEGLYLIESAGPDSEFGTGDDIKSWKKPGT
jgi:prepilin-type N-terminal cleavage/methylation domain-containing protein